MTTRIYAGDCRDVLATLPDASVHCVVTSPPYYGLRDYGVAGQMGLEASPPEYIQAMVAVFREVRRVLRPDGTLWLNIGDSYNANQGNGWTPTRGHNGHASPKVSSGGLAPKQLLMMPARLALALQADGWWLRSDIIWAKPNPMPESVRDRPTSAHEHVFLLTRSARYYYDADAVREEFAYSGDVRVNTQYWKDTGKTTQSEYRKPLEHAGRNCRNVWTIPTEAFSAAHFATFPTALAERCIRAGTSERGCCAACGAPWVRQTSVSYTDAGNGNNNMKRKGGDYEAAMSARPYEVRKLKDVETLGWSAQCQCNAAVVPATVLDPFAGAGTTLLVADRLQRDAIGIDLNADYTRMAMARCQADAPLLTHIADAADDAYDQPMRDLFQEAAD